jgi:hypothetical protein
MRILLISLFGKKQIDDLGGRRSDMARMEGLAAVIKSLEDEISGKGNEIQLVIVGPQPKNPKKPMQL